MSTLQAKAQISAGAALLFALVNLPFTYKLTDSLLPVNTYNHATGCPTATGLIVHAGVFFLITYLGMNGARASNATKVKNSFYGTLIFLLVSSPMVYSFVGSLLGPVFADAAGCPTTTGVLLHAVVYFLALIGVMYLPLK